MDAKSVIYIVFFLLVIPRFLSFTWAQVQDIRGLISDIASPQRNLDLGMLPFKGSCSYSSLDAIARKPVSPDTNVQMTGFTAGKIDGYNPAMLLMMQSLMSRQEILLEYFTSDTMIYIVALTRESVGVYSTRTSRQFWNEVNIFQRNIRLADFGDSRKQSEDISGVLLGTVFKKIKGKTKAVIIAHDALYGFPFEALTYPGTGSNGVKTRYLIEITEVVYNHSTAQWLSSRIGSKISRAKSNPGDNLAFAGFSPGFEYSECIQELRNSDHEVSTIGKMFRARGMTDIILLNENSKEYNFKSIARFSNILHIATHTIVSEERPEMNGLLFYEFGSERGNDNNSEDGLLAVHEICELRIPADLIVINACASANIRGRIGVNWFSCSDCFMQAGAKNVLCTLWNVSDRLAEKFMVEFYKNYLSGMSFSRALQKVKLGMINEQSTSLPINWAAYVLIGE